MLTVSNRTDWESVFESVDPLVNCNVKIYDKNDNLLLDKDHISSYSLLSRNSFVCDNIPTDECKIEILNWSSLSNTTKTYLTTHSNDYNYYLKVKYVVNGVETTGFKYLVVKKFKVHRLQRNATFELASPLSCLSERATNFLLGYYTTGYSTNWGTKYAKYTLTRAELFPIRSLQERKGVKYVYGSGTQDTEYTTKDLTVSTNDGNFDEINIYNDYSIDTDEPDKSSINLYGAERSMDIDDLTATFTTGGTLPELTLTDEVFAYDFSVLTSGGGTYRSYYRLQVYNDKLKLVRRPNSGTLADGISLTLTVNCYTPNLKNPTDNTKPYLQSVGVPVLGTNGVANCKDYVRTYYGNTNVVSFDCRIDPTLEPLDLIGIELSGNTYRLALEEVLVNFNGGFTGSIKGRIMEMVASIAFGTQPYKYRENGQPFEFGGTVIGTFYDGSTKDVTSSCTFTGSGTITVSYTQKGVTKELTYYLSTFDAFHAPDVILNSVDATHLNISVRRNTNDSTQVHADLLIKNSQGQTAVLQDYYHTSGYVTFEINSSSYPDAWNIIKDDCQAYAGGLLMANVTCLFTVENHYYYPETTVLAKQFLAPAVSGMSVGSHDMYFTLVNNNSFAVIVYIVSSKGSLAYLMSANSSKFFDSDYEVDEDLFELLETSILEYNNYSLDDPVICYFKKDNFNSETAIILESDY